MQPSQPAPQLRMNPFVAVHLAALARYVPVPRQKVVHSLMVAAIALRRGQLLQEPKKGGFTAVAHRKAASTLAF